MSFLWKQKGRYRFETIPAFMLLKKFYFKNIFLIALFP